MQADVGDVAIFDDQHGGEEHVAVLPRDGGDHVGIAELVFWDREESMYRTVVLLDLAPRHRRRFD